MTNRNKKIWNGNVRDAALSILIEINDNQAYSNLLLHRTIEKYGIEAKDRGLLTELTYGTLQHRMTLDYYLEPFVRGKLDKWVRELLRMSLYQIVYLTKIPPHAVVHEAVEIAKRRGHKRIAPTVNGILRSVLRKGVRSLDTLEDGVAKIAIETSHPEWLIARWIELYGEEDATAMAHENNNPAPIAMRVNTVKMTRDEAIVALESEGFEVSPGDIVAESLISNSGNPANTEAYKKGLVTIQDESSMLPVNALDLVPGMRVLDMCAAPGGKTTHIAEKMNNEGEVFAHDVHNHKIKLIETNAERLGLTSITAKSGDSRKLVDVYGEASFDRILLDAPCTGFGVIRRKPEIKYVKNESDLEGLLTIQSELLETAEKLIKPNGIIVYSTCTVEYKENRGMVEKFLKTNENMELIPLPTLKDNKNLAIEGDTLQVLPQHFGGDGFFVAALRKKN
ncbi:16S rRNA (cytosine(967)-C(5))-methyltransferase RsmB [Sporosarcina sp. G11-34]|uniref:16S rRNA (cytosine(967)-C(5))-methyltransferase RsmB n=1 Tax=Sporosarcina sp. G11-34 TaxID=2849605 RepID=UPI0022A9EDAE|nr:16S rRNA (cytosine(967)-C(5))-methyltransferase RsmB [Sporosarcina sp. G11-34]MCZ2257075.1 16S rRNA (cytosine(967)-C(5))-methyltransferase RsmB [Sporosarcina sp. G11-34]